MECKFPAKQLAQYRAYALTCSKENPTVAAEIVLRIDQLRLAHEDLDGCRCWYDAISKPVSEKEERS